MKIEIKKIDRPIWIGTIPRSRSSMIAGIFKRCGAFTGSVEYGFHNSRGLYENPIITNACFYDTVNDAGGLKGLFNLYTNDIVPKLPLFKETFTFLMNQQGYKKGATIYKHAIHLFFIDQIMKEFPNSIWIFPKRKIEDIIKSHIKTWKLSDEQINKHCIMWAFLIDAAIKKYPKSCYIVDTDKIVKESEFANIKNIVHKIEELNWKDDSVKDWVNSDSIQVHNKEIKPRNSARGFWI